MTATSDACTIARKSIQELLSTSATTQSGYLRLIAAMIIGGVYGWHAGVVDAGSFVLVAGVATFLVCSAVLPAAADSFAGERERHTLETLLATRASDRSIVLGKYLGRIAAAGGATPDHAWTATRRRSPWRRIFYSRRSSTGNYCWRDSRAGACGRSRGRRWHDGVDALHHGEGRTSTTQLLYWPSLLFRSCSLDTCCLKIGFSLPGGTMNAARTPSFWPMPWPWYC